MSTVVRGAKGQFLKFSLNISLAIILYHSCMTYIYVHIQAFKNSHTQTFHSMHPPLPRGGGWRILRKPLEGGDWNLLQFQGGQFAVGGGGFFRGGLKIGCIFFSFEQMKRYIYNIEKILLQIKIHIRGEQKLF